MALESMRRALTPRENEETAGGSDTFFEELESAANRRPSAWTSMSPDEQLRWTLAAPGASEPLDPRSTVAYLDSLQGKLAPADPLPPFTTGGSGITPEIQAESEAVKRLMVARKEGLPPSGADRISLQKPMSPGSLASPIPFASAPVKADVPEATKGAITATTPTQPAPPANGSGGDDEMASLRKQLGIQQMFEALGSAGSGKNLYTDGGILADRMKQIEALRAKRAQTAEERALEQQQFEGANLGTLTSNIAAFKDRPEVVAALENLRASAKFTKPSDFLKAVYQAVMNPPTLAGKEAGVEKTGAQTAQVEERTTTEKEVRPGKVRKLKTAADLDEARIRALNAKSAADALALTKSRAAVADAGKAGTPSKDAIKYIRDDLKTAEKAITPTLENFKAIEAASPGFAFGRPDKELETLEFVTAAKLPRFSKQASDLRSAVEALIIDIRHGSFGASLTATEKESFEAMLNTGLSGTVGQLSKAIDRVRRKAAATAQTHFNTSQQFYPTETRQVLSTSAVFGPATRKGGVYADVWTLPEAPAAAGGGVEPSVPKVPTESQIAKLRANPDRAADFDKLFGSGAAAKILGGE
jgi:hypothetical protein